MTRAKNADLLGVAVEASHGNKKQAELGQAALQKHLLDDLSNLLFALLVDEPVEQASGLIVD